MSFSKEQVKQLEAPLDAKHVKSRQQAGQTFSYIEGWHVIAEANRIFGHDAWDSTVEIVRLAEPEQIDGKWRARFMAIVTIRVRAGETVTTRQGVGYGSGIARDLGDALEGAVKEAETDARKRALMTFGWPFGLALYDKSRENVCDKSADDAKAKYIEGCQAIIDGPHDGPGALVAWWNGQGEKRRNMGLTNGDIAPLMERIKKRKAELEPADEPENILAGG